MSACRPGLMALRLSGRLSHTNVMPPSRSMRMFSYFLSAMGLLSFVLNPIGTLAPSKPEEVSTIHSALRKPRRRAFGHPDKVLAFFDRRKQANTASKGGTHENLDCWISRISVGRGNRCGAAGPVQRGGCDHGSLAPRLEKR